MRRARLIPLVVSLSNHAASAQARQRRRWALFQQPAGFLGMQYDFQWSVLWTGGHGQWLLQGIGMTLRLSVLSWVIACALGILSGALRTAPFAPLRFLAAAYVEFFRNVPLLVWLFFWYFGVPQVLPRAAQDWLNQHGPEFWSAVAGLSVYHGARMSEVIRAGIQSIPKTLLEASVATGLTVAQAYRLIIIPIALRLIVPPLTNESLNLLKNSSLALTIGVAELVFMTRQIETYTAKAFEALTAGTLLYLVLCLGIAAIMAQVEHHFRIPGLIARAGRAEH
jgi:polar amino acid transport system permease protein